MANGISVVVPVKDEVENVGPLVDEIVAAIASETPTEIIFVDDGSTDGTTDALTSLKRRVPQLRVVRHARNAGQSRSIRTGVRAARFDVVVTLDGDGQNDPADIPKLLAVLRSTTGAKVVGLVSGIRAQRKEDRKSTRLNSSH